MGIGKFVVTDVSSSHKKRLALLYAVCLAILFLLVVVFIDVFGFSGISCCVPALLAFALCFAFACSLVGRRQSCDVWPDYVGLVSLYLYMCFICSVVVASMMSCGCRCCYVFLVVFACCVFLLVN